MVKPSTSGSSPLSPTHWPPEAFNARANIVFILAVVVAIAVGFVVSLVIAGTVTVLTHQRLTQGSATFRWVLIVTQALLYVPVMFAVTHWLPRTAKRSLTEIGIRRLTRRDAVTGLIGAVAMYLAVAAAAFAQYLALHVKAEQNSVKLLASGHDPLFWAAFAILACVLAPLVEESIFRGFIFNAFLRYTPLWIAVAASGVLFGLGHGEPTAALPLACGGAVLALVYYRTGSLASSMLTHATFNFVNVIAVIATGGAG